MERTGPKAASVADTRTRKTLMDRLRTQDTALRRHLVRRTETELQHSRWIVFGFVLLFGGGILAFGMIVVERQARRDRQRSVQRREYVEALQGADDELEAEELLRRRAERVVPSAEAVVLTRNASGNSLDASTDPSAVDGLADALTHATPSSCLAIRRGRLYEREPGSEPLQSCELCGKAAGAALCVPSLVGGEVIGSLLVMKPRAFKPGECEGVTATVARPRPCSRSSVEAIEQRLRSHRFRYPHQGLVYEQAGHGIGIPTPYLPGATTQIGIGGTARADAAAKADLWRHILAFLAGQDRGRRG